MHVSGLRFEKFRRVIIFAKNRTERAIWENCHLTGGVVAPKMGKQIDYNLSAAQYCDPDRLGLSFVARLVRLEWRCGQWSLWRSMNPFHGGWTKG